MLVSQKKKVLPIFPPMSIPLTLIDTSTENVPPPFVNQKTERKERHSVERHVHQGVYRSLIGVLVVLDESYLLHVVRGVHGKRYRVPDCLVKPGVGPSTQRNGLVLVLDVVLNVAHFVVDGDEVFCVYACAHFNPVMF